VSEAESRILPAAARAVVIGGGIVGNSLAGWLCELGWRDVLLLDKGPFPNPGGSTGHASNFIYPVDHSKEMTQLTLESMRQYRQTGTLIECGGLEVARTEARMEELRRRMASAKSWGVEGCRLVTPAEIKELVPYLNEEILLGGFYTPSVAVVDSLRFGTIMREKGQASGALQVFPNTEVRDIDVEDGRVQRVRTDRGDVETEVVVVACGIWSPRIARMAGAEIPLTPAVHQMIDVGPVPRFLASKTSIEYPIVRDMDTNMYERPILHEPDEIPSIEEAALSPTELPFTQEDFEQQLADALELVPEILGDESVGIKYAINGLLSLTPDGLPLLGETPEVKGLWSAAAVWVKEGPGVGKSLAEWMVLGEPEIDLQASDVARFHDEQKTAEHVKGRAAEGFNKTYGIVHPSEQWESNRRVRTAPFYDRERELGAVFYEVAAWERPHWYESNAPLVEKYGVESRPHEWDARWWSPIINAEHLAMRESAAMFDLTAFCVFDVVGPGALDCVQQVAMRQMDVKIGRNVYTPVLSHKGGFKSDLTIMRMDDDRFRVVTGGAHGMADKKWFADHVPADGATRIEDLTADLCTVGLWGPRARDVLASVTSDDVSDEGFPFATFRTVSVDGLDVLASRISYVGDLGWELYAPMADGARLWDVLWEAGRPHGVVPAGIGVYGTTGRLEKCYRAFGFELDADFTVVEADMAWGKVKEQDFVGKEAYVSHRESEPVALLCTLGVEDNTSKSGIKRYMLGREPITTRDGTPLTDAKGRRSYVTSAGAAPSVGAYVLMAYLPREQATAGNELAVEYMGELYPVRVMVAGSTPIFDPENARIRS
jgi:glycine cleavage system aminomethyltransferase T/glycine/D-amino acid oxidase-like deaminating enzyme